MKVINTYIVMEHNAWHTLFECENGKWFKASNGAFHPRDMTIIQISAARANVLISSINPATT